MITAPQDPLVKTRPHVYTVNTIQNMHVMYALVNHEIIKSRDGGAGGVVFNSSETFLVRGRTQGRRSEWSGRSKVETTVRNH